ncbi:MAG: hypothetical protein V4773_25780, partial [Verrucomicrobiota bacterium]
MDIASSPWLNPVMRPQLAVVCAFLFSLVAPLHAQVRWNFTSGTAPTSPPSVITGGAITAVNSESGPATVDGAEVSTGYDNASGGNNLAIHARIGNLSVTPTYLQFTLTPTAGVNLKAVSVALGTRSTATGPTALLLFSSVNAFATAIGTANVAADGTWRLVTFSALALDPGAGTPLTFRIYGNSGSGTEAANWRVDDVRVTFAGPTVTAQPSPVTVISGEPAAFSVTATGAGTLTYQWRRG